MEETTQEFYKDRVQAQENRILELQQRNMDSNINEQSIDLDYDLYLEHEYLFPVSYTHLTLPTNREV